MAAIRDSIWMYELVNRLKAYRGQIAIYIRELEALAWEEKRESKEKQMGLSDY